MPDAVLPIRVAYLGAGYRPVLLFDSSFTTSEGYCPVALFGNTTSIMLLESRAARDLSGLASSLGHLACGVGGKVVAAAVTTWV